VVQGVTAKRTSVKISNTHGNNPSLLLAAAESGATKQNYDLHHNVIRPLSELGDSLQ
jgi:hypothetical protein